MSDWIKCILSGGDAEMGMESGSRSTFVYVSCGLAQLGWLFCPSIKTALLGETKTQRRVDVAMNFFRPRFLP